MPKILENRVKSLIKSGMDKNKAYAIATSSLKKEGKLIKGTSGRLVQSMR